MKESQNSQCPVCNQPSRLFIMGQGKWHHHQGCDCIEVRIQTKLLNAGLRLDKDEFPFLARMKISEDARKTPTHNYLAITSNKGLIRETGSRWQTTVLRRRRDDPPRPSLEPAQ